MMLDNSTSFIWIHLLSGLLQRLFNIIQIQEGHMIAHDQFIFSKKYTHYIETDDDIIQAILLVKAAWGSRNMIILLVTCCDGFLYLNNIK